MYLNGCTILRVDGGRQLVGLHHSTVVVNTRLAILAVEPSHKQTLYNYNVCHEIQKKKLKVSRR